MTDFNAKYYALRERFISRLPDRLEKLKQSFAELAAGHEEARLVLRREAHSLVGAAGIHQLNALAQVARNLEKISEETDLNAIEQTLARLEVALLQPETQPDKTSSASIGTGRIVLVCQDEEELASQTALLESAGHSVIAVKQLDTFRSHLGRGLQADLFLLGLQFDGDDSKGLELLQEIHLTVSHTPVIVFSASHGMPTQLSAFMKGASAFIAKPISADELLGAVSAALIKNSHVHLRLLALCNTENEILLQKLTSASGIEWLVTNDTEAFLREMDTNHVDGVVLVEPCPMPGVKTLSALINGQSWEHRPPLVVIEQVHLTEGFSLWIHAVFKTKLAEHISIREVFKRYKTLQQEQKRQNLAIDHHTIISVADKTGTVIETSNRMSELLGWPRTALIGSHLWDQRPGQPPAEFDSSQVKQALANGIWQGEVALRNRDGAPLWFQSTLVAFLSHEGVPYRYMVIRSDITQQKLAEQALESSKAKASELATKMQAALLVPPLPGCVGNVPVASYFSAASDMGGDFHALTEHGPDCFDLLIGDVMGKGLHAAIVGAAVKLEANRCLIELKRASSLPSPGEIVHALDERLRPKLQAFECFVTLVYLRCDLTNATITHVGCGHPESLLIHDQRVERLGNHHPPLGVLPLSTHDQTTSAWAAGSSVFMYTDGLTEVLNSNGDILGEEALIAALTQRTALMSHPSTTAAAALRAAAEHQGNHPQTDDWTLIALRRPLANEQYIELQGNFTCMSTLRHAVREIPLLKSNHVLCDRTELVASEVFSNIVRHGLTPVDEPPVIHVGLKWTDHGIDLSFHYRGKPFNPVGPMPLPDPEMLNEGGMGLPLIFSLSSSVHYEYNHDLCSCFLSLIE